MSYRIFIIEALPDSTKLKTGQGIFIDLENWCKGSDIIPKYYAISSKKELKEKIIEIIRLANEDDTIIFHIESHGNDDGIGLVNDCIGWEEFWQEIQPLSEKVDNRVTFILSMCRSKYSICALSESQMAPFQNHIVSKDIVDSGPACLAFKKFYKNYVNSKNVQEAFKSLLADYTWFNKECPFMLLSRTDVERVIKDISCPHNLELLANNTETCA